ncbi:ATP-binding protein [Streptacidiphilus rugosus]|uniref:ATP-binding protein n=1 Tax=Streptacidiphilus rugosus TaxID=405783 RepID=UPI00068A1CE5|nr:AAA family ATPase [Streptacidiphilus rugosus]
MRLLLERDIELAAVRAAVAELAEGRAGAGSERLLVVTGAAGLGKTTMLAAVRRDAEAAGLLVLHSRGGEQEQGSAFSVVRGLLRTLLEESGEEGRRELLGGWYEIVGAALGLDATGGAPDPQGVRDGLDWVVTNLAVSRGPLVLLVDDAHWADAESLTWLAAFASRVAELPVLLVVAYRPDELPDWADAFRGMAGDNGVQPLGLSALTPEAVDALVREMYTQDGGHSTVEDGFSREIWAVTGGNPFETVQLVAEARDRGIAPAEASWGQLRELASENTGHGLIARLRRLGHGAVDLAHAVAVLGIATPMDLATVVASQRPSEAEAAAEKLRAARILTGRRILEFVHPLIATSVYHSIPEETRARLHDRAAWSVLEAGRSPVVAVRHWLEVPPQGDAGRVEQLRAAARLFMQSGAPETAQRCLARAAAEPPPVAERAAVLFELGCSTLLYDPAATAGQLRTALQQPVIPVRLREEISVRLAQSLAHSNSLAEAATTMADEAQRAEDEAVRLKMQVWNFMWCAFDAWEQGSEERSKRLAMLAESLDHAGDRSMAARYILGLRAWDATVRGEPVNVALHYSDLALSGELRWAHPEWGFEVPVLVAMTYMYGDRPERALELFAQGIAEYEEAGWRGAHLAFGHTILGYVHYRTGDLAAAEASARLGLELANRVGEGTPAHWYAVGTLIAVLTARGELDQAEELAGRYEFGAPYSNAVVFPDAQTVRGGLLLTQGRFVDAEAELSEAGARLDGRGMRNPGWCGWERALSAACAGLGDLARARELAADQLDRAERFGTLTAIGVAMRAAAELTVDPEERVAQLEEAVTILERAPAPYERARAVFDLAAALDAVDRDAAPVFRRAAQLAETCSADALALAARARLGG